MTSYHGAGFNMDWTPPAYLDTSRFSLEEVDRLVREFRPTTPVVKRAVPVTRPSDAEIQRKIDNARLVAQGLEFLLKVWPSIPGASVTLTPDQQDELKQIILALPAAVVL